MRCRALGCWSWVLLLSACASAPTHFYTLLPPPQDHALVAKASTPQPASPTSTPADFAIDVEPVGVPSEVDQAAWLVRTGPGQVAVLDNERWAAPLGDELRSAFSDALTRELGARDVRGAANPGSGPMYRIRVDVRRFESVPGHYALIKADWSVTGQVGEKPATTLSCSSNASQPVGPGFAALAVGHQRDVATIAAAIAHAVHNLAAGKDICPQNEGHGT